MEPLKKIIRIRTGGQSGVDRAAMDFAREHGIPLCGWCPKSGWADDYPDAPGLLADYPELTETPSENTEQRTKWNMRDSDAILTIIPEGAGYSLGTETGLAEGEALGKAMYTATGLNDIPYIVKWLNSLSDELELCIGGPRASESPEAYDTAKAILNALFEHISSNDKKHYVYILKCADNSFYTGYTTDPVRRTKVHNSGKGAKYTRSRRPVELIYTEEFDDKREAQRREYAIKQLTRTEKEKLIKGRLFSIPM